MVCGTWPDCTINHKSFENLCRTELPETIADIAENRQIPLRWRKTPKLSTSATKGMKQLLNGTTRNYYQHRSVSTCTISKLNVLWYAVGTESLTAR